MTASGVPDRTSNNPTIMCSLALDMHDAAQSVLINNKEPIKVRHHYILILDNNAR